MHVFRAGVVGCIVLLLVPGFVAADPVPVPEKFSDDCVGPPPGLVGWWSLDRADGPAFDLIGGNHGQRFGAPLAEPAAVAGGLVFDGVDDYVEVSDSPLLDIGDGNFSVDFWIRTTVSSGIQVVLDKRSQFQNFLAGYHIFLFNGHPGLQLADGRFTNYVATEAFLADGTFHHVAITVDRTGPFDLLKVATFFVDGELVASRNVADRTGSLSNSSVLRIGARSTSLSGHFDGVLDEIQVFRRVLGRSEIEDIAQAGHAGKCKCAKLSGLPVAWWTFDERADATAVDIAGHFSGPHSAELLGPSRVFGQVGQGLRFDGVDDEVRVTNPAGLSHQLAEPGGFTVDAWIRTSQTDGPVVSQLGPSPNDFLVGYSLRIEGGLPEFIISTLDPDTFLVDGFRVTCTSSICNSLNLSDDRWHFLAATISHGAQGRGVQVHLYVDGQFAGSAGPRDLFSIFGFGPIRVGLEGVRLLSFFEGWIDEVEIFDRALTGAEIASIFAAGRAGKCRLLSQPQVCNLPGSPNCPAGQFCDFTSSSDCGNSLAGGICRPRPEICTFDEDPVCGCDGVTYSNACHAHWAGVSVACEGECDP